MSNIDGRGVPLPANDNVWENWISHVLEAKYGRPANAYGRSGQKQCGIDFVVYDGDVRIGIQCKFVSQGSKLNVKQVAADIDAARSIDPPIKRFILYTSASSDPGTIDLLDSLKPEAHAQNQDFTYFMWRDFEEEVRKYNLFDRLDGKSTWESATEQADEPGRAVSVPKIDSKSVTETATAVYPGSAALYSGMLDQVKDHLVSSDMAGAMAIVDVLLKSKDTIPDAELARAYATKAILVSRSGNAVEAARLWQKSVDIGPSETLRHGRRAQALLCENRYDEALIAALPGLDTNPPSALAAVAALICGQHLGRRADIDARLSGRLKSDRDVGLIRAHMALSDGDGILAESIIATVAKEHPNDADVSALQADLLLFKVIGNQGKTGAHAILGSERHTLEAAIPLYQAALLHRDPIREKASWLPACLNLISVFKLLSRDKDAAEVALSIFDKIGSVPDEFDRLILVLAEGGRETQALTLSEGKALDDVKLQLARASALMHLDQFGRAEKILESVETKASAADADNLGWMLLVTRMQTQPGANLATLAENYYQNAQNKLYACKRIVDNASRLGHRQIANQYAQKAVDLYQSDNDLEFIVFVVDALIMLDQKDEALQLLLPQVDLDHPQGSLLDERLAFCLLRLQRLETLDKLLAGLPQSGPDAIRFDPYRIDYHFACSDRPGALAAVRNAVARKPADLKLHALEVWLLREAGDLSEAKSRLETTEYQSNAPLSAITLYVREAQKLDSESKADELVYRWIRENGDVPEHAAWFLTYVLTGKKYHEISAPLQEVSNQCGVCLKAVNEKERFYWIVIDDRFPENIAGGWYATHSDRIMELLGKPIKSTVSFGAFPNGPFLIELIVPVIYGAFRLIHSRYGNQIPMADSLRYVSLKGKNDEYDPSSIFTMLDNRKKATLDALSVYAETPIPIGVLARAMGRNPIDVWSGLAGSDRYIKAMSGHIKSNMVFMERLKLGAPDIVLDPLTLVSWEAFDLLPSALKAVQSISMTVSALDVIKNKRAELEIGDGLSHMVLGASEQDGLYERSEVTPEMAAAKRQVFDRLLDWVDQHVSIVPVPSSGLPEDIYSAMRISWPPYIADSLQLAAKENRILIADDLALEKFAVALNVSQVPTAALFRSAVSDGRITTHEFVHALQELMKAQYEFISINVGDIYIATDLRSFAITPGVDAMLRYLQIPSIDLPRGLVVVCDYLQMLSGKSVSPNLITAALTISLSALSRHATRDTPQVFKTLVQFISQRLPRPYADAAMSAVSQWFTGHFLTLEDVGIHSQPSLGNPASPVRRHKGDK